MRFATRALVCVAALIIALPLVAAEEPNKPRAVTIEVASDLTTEKARAQESNLADVIVDAIRSAAKADVGLVPASWFVETTIAKGQASTEQFLQALDLRTDTIVVMKLTGDQIKRGLEHGLALYPGKNPAFLQVSGITVTIDGAPEVAKRVLTAKVGKAAIVDDKKYTVAMPSPLANGALAYQKVWTKADVDQSLKTTVEQAVTTYLAAQKTVGAKAEDRIVVKK
jgi:5'-nucleotidase / UDP-sugar diphosphatase